MIGSKEKNPAGYTACPKSTHEHDADLRLKKYKNYIVVGIVTFLNVTFVVSITVLVYRDVQRHETPKQSNQTCMTCQTLSTIVDRWAWRNVTEDKHTDTCCFNSDTGLSATLKYYFEKRISSSLSETERLQENVDQLHTLVWNNLLSNRTNATSIPPYTHPYLSTLMDLINNIFHRKRSVLHLTSLKTVSADGSDPKISWASNIKQGPLSLSNDTCSVSIMSTGLYFISTQVKFRANVFNNQTMKTTAQFYLATLREGQLSHVDDYKKRYVFRERNTEHDANLLSMTRLESGDSLIIRFPTSQKSYLASERGAHRISMFEVS